MPSPETDFVNVQPWIWCAAPSRHMSPAVPFSAKTEPATVPAPPTSRAPMLSERENSHCAASRLQR